MVLGFAEWHFSPFASNKTCDSCCGGYCSEFIYLFIYFFLLQEVTYRKNRVLLLQRAKDALV